MATTRTTSRRPSQRARRAGTPPSSPRRHTAAQRALLGALALPARFPALPRSPPLTLALLVLPHLGVPLRAALGLLPGHHAVWRRGTRPSANAARSWPPSAQPRPHPRPMAPALRHCADARAAGHAQKPVWIINSSMPAPSRKAPGHTLAATRRSRRLRGSIGSVHSAGLDRPKPGWRCDDEWRCGKLPNRRPHCSESRAPDGAPAHPQALAQALPHVQALENSARGQGAPARRRATGACDGLTL